MRAYVPFNDGLTGSKHIAVMVVAGDSVKLRKNNGNKI